MPCFCWIDDSDIEAEMVIIRQHVREIVKYAKIIDARGDLTPKSGPLPRDIINDIHTLLNDLYNERCSEK